MLVSIVIPIYNVENYLNQCIESILNQTYKNLEIILVDDGSTDNSPRICDSYQSKDKRIKVLHQTNKGLSNARNTGMYNSNGEYIYFLDSDDYLANNAIEKLIDIAYNNDLDAIYFGANVINQNGNVISNHHLSNRYHRKNHYSKIYTGSELFKMLIKNNEFYSCVPLSFYKRDSIKHTFSDIVHEDELFTIQQLYCCNRVMCIDDNLYIRRFRDNSITTTYKTHSHYLGMVNVIKGLFAISNIDKSILRYIGTLYFATFRIYYLLSNNEKELVIDSKNELEKLIKTDNYHHSLKLFITHHSKWLYYEYLRLKKLIFQL